MKMWGRRTGLAYLTNNFSLSFNCRRTGAASVVGQKVSGIIENSDIAPHLEIQTLPYISEFSDKGELFFSNVEYRLQRCESTFAGNNVSSC